MRRGVCQQEEELFKSSRFHCTEGFQKPQHCFNAADRSPSTAWRKIRVKKPPLFTIKEKGFSICKLMKLHNLSVSKFPVVLLDKCLDKFILADPIAVTCTLVLLLRYCLPLSRELQWQTEAKSVKVLDGAKKLSMEAKTRLKTKTNCLC